MEFYILNWYTTDLLPWPKLFKEWQPCFWISSLKPDNQNNGILLGKVSQALKYRLSFAIGLYYSTLAERGGNWTLPVATSCWQKCFGPSCLQQKENFRTNKYNYKSFNTTMIADKFWLNLYNMVCFSSTVYLLYNCSEQNFVELQRFEAARYLYWSAPCGTLLWLPLPPVMNVDSYSQKAIGHCWKDHCICAQTIWRNQGKHCILEQNHTLQCSCNREP